MKAGEINAKVTIYREERVRSEYGTSTKNQRIEVLRTRARRRFSSGGVQVSARETFYNVNVIFSFYKHCKPYIKCGYLIEHEGESFRVLSVEENARYRCLIVATEKENE